MEEEEGELKNFVTILISIIVGALISLWIHNRYGSEIFENLQLETIFEIIFASVVYIIIFAIFIAFLSLIIKIRWTGFEWYFEPIKKANKYLRKKSKIVKKIEDALQFDVETHYKKRPYLFKTLFFRVILILVGLKFYRLIVSSLGLWISIMIGIYSFICILFFIIMLIKKVYR